MHHLSITYGAPGDWFYRDPGQIGDLSGLLMTLFVAINQSYFMGFFFLISSYFAPGSYDRKGPGPYLRDRFIRLGIPLVFYVLVIGWLVHYTLAANLRGFEGSILAFYPLYLEHFNGGYVGPMWFVEFLLVLSVLYVLWRQFVKNPAAPPTGEGKAPGSLAMAAFGLAVGLVTFVVRLWMPMGTSFEPMNLQIPFVPQYIAMVVAGLFAHRRGWFAALSRGTARRWLVAVIALIVLFPVFLVVGVGLDGDPAVVFGGPSWQALFFAVWEQLMAVAMIVVLTVWFRERFNRQGGLARAMSGAAYSAYVIHPLVLVPLAIALRSVRLDLALKFVLFAPVFVGGTFLLASGIKQLPVAKDIV
jgi:hypothetical protein